MTRIIRATPGLNPGDEKRFSVIKVTRLARSEMHIPAVAANVRPIADYPKQVNDVVRSFPGDWASAVTLASVLAPIVANNCHALRHDLKLTLGMLERDGRKIAYDL